jgi:hypothetical protein
MHRNAQHREKIAVKSDDKKQLSCFTVFYRRFLLLFFRDVEHYDACGI